MSLRGNANQAEVAASIGVPQSSLSNWETNKARVPAEAIAKLARHYNVSADYLVLLTDHPTGLGPEMWIVDLDALGAGKRGDYAVQVPTRHRVVTYNELQQLEREAEKVHGKKGRTKGGDHANT